MRRLRFCRNLRRLEAGGAWGWGVGCRWLFLLQPVFVRWLARKAKHLRVALATRFYEDLVLARAKWRARVWIAVVRVVAPAVLRL